MLSDAGSLDDRKEGGGGGGSGSGDGSDGGTSPPANGQMVLDACLDQTGIAERCTLVTNATACTTTKCSKLVVVFSSGEMGCLSGAG